MDVAAFGLAIGTVVGRIGDLAIVEHLGGPTRFALGYGIRPGYDVAPQHDRLECVTATVGEFCGIYHHAALYDMLAAAVCFGSSTGWSSGRASGSATASCSPSG